MERGTASGAGRYSMPASAGTPRGKVEKGGKKRSEETRREDSIMGE